MKWSADGKISKADFGIKIFDVSLAAFVAAFLDGVSVSTVEKAVSAGLNTFGKLKNASVEDLMRLCGCGESKAESIKYGILEHEKEMKEVIANGDIKLIMPLPEIAPAVSLNGYSFCFTGPLETMTRMEAREKARLLGGITFSTVKSGLSFLVTNDTESGSSKNRAAKDLGVVIINEDEFSGIINNPGRAGFYFNRGCPPSGEKLYRTM